MGQHPAGGLKLGAQLIFKDFFGVNVCSCQHVSIQKASEELCNEAGVSLTLVARRLLRNVFQILAIAVQRSKAAIPAHSETRMKRVLKILSSTCPITEAVGPVILAQLYSPGLQGGWNQKYRTTKPMTPVIKAPLAPNLLAMVPMSPTAEPRLFAERRLR